MSLIDKDRLLKGSNHYWLEMENFGDIEAIDVRFIEMAEEIKAIPIEYIEKVIKSFDCEEGNKLRPTWAHVLKSLIEFWEFENGEEENETN